uniref:U19-like protein n=1 Tax=Glypta fumiferanae TaxID=389681 RepID=A0A0F6T1E7_9HYME|nr:U19-like protein [Glypta fumiferanae]
MNKKDTIRFQCYLHSSSKNKMLFSCVIQFFFRYTMTMSVNVSRLIKHTMRHGKVSPGPDEWCHTHYSQHLVIDVGSYVGALYRLKNDISHNDQLSTFLMSLDSEVRFIIPQINTITIDCSKMTQQVVNHDRTVAVKNLFNTFLHAIMDNYNRESYNPVHATHIIIADCCLSILWQEIYSCINQTGYQCERLTLIRCMQIELSSIARFTFTGLCLRDCHFVFTNRCTTPIMLDSIDIELQKYDFKQWYRTMANNMVHGIMDSITEMNTVVSAKCLKIHCPTDKTVSITALSLILFNMGITFEPIVSFHIDVDMIPLPEASNKTPIVKMITNDFDAMLLRAKGLGVVCTVKNLSVIDNCESLVDLKLLTDNATAIATDQRSLSDRTCERLESLSVPLNVLNLSSLRFYNLKYMDIDCHGSGASSDDDIVGKILTHCLGLNTLSLRNTCRLRYDFIDDNVTIFSPKLTSLHIDCHADCIIEPLRMIDKFELHELNITLNQDPLEASSNDDKNDVRRNAEYINAKIGECGRGNLKKITVTVRSEWRNDDVSREHLEWRDLMKFQIVHALYEKYGLSDRGTDDNGESAFVVNFNDISMILGKRDDPQIQLWTHLLYHMKKSSSEHRPFVNRNGVNFVLIVRTNLPPIADLSLKIATSRSTSGSGIDLSLLLEKCRSVTCECANNDDDDDDDDNDQMNSNVWPSNIFKLLHRVAS